MPPLPQWFAGRDAIRGFLVAGPLAWRWRFLQTQANASPAFATYMWTEAAAAWLPKGLDVLTIRDGKVTEVVSFLEADFADFGLPTRLGEAKSPPDR